MTPHQQIYDVYRSAGFQDTNTATVAEGYSQLLQWLCEPSAPILDFGCGGGDFLAFIRGHGFTALHGIDSSLQQVERCHERGPHQRCLGH